MKNFNFDVNDKTIASCQKFEDAQLIYAVLKKKYTNLECYANNLRIKI